MTKENKLYEGVEIKETIKQLKDKYPYLKVSDFNFNIMPDKREEILNQIIIKSVGKDRIKEIKKQKIHEVLEKKMSEFEFEYDEEKEEYISGNVTDEERELYNHLFRSIIEKINQKLKEKGINNYIFRLYLDKLNIIGLSGDGIEEIDKDLQGKEHYLGIDELGLPSLDFEKKDDESLKEFLERLEKYAEEFSKYYNGENINNSVKFDQNGDIIEESKVKKSDFAEVANNREAMIELLSGRIVEEINEQSKGLEKNNIIKGGE